MLGPQHDTEWKIGRLQYKGKYTVGPRAGEVRSLPTLPLPQVKGFSLTFRDVALMQSGQLLEGCWSPER